MDKPRNPYVGSKPFEEEDKQYYFGREREWRDLLARVISRRVVVFFAQSGAGKSSLINARLLPGLRNTGFASLNVGRVSGELPDCVEGVDNVFIFNLIRSLFKPEADPDLNRFSHLKLSEFLGQNREEDGYFPTFEELTQRTIDPDMQEQEDRHTVLVIDQFEEIFTTNLVRWQERDDFFQQLNQTLQENSHLWVVIAMRSDYVASLEPYAKWLEDRMRTRFYMERMEKAAAIQAIVEPARLAGREFDLEAADALVNDLTQINIPGTDQVGHEQHVELLQLQVVCEGLWENVESHPPGPITQKDLETFGKVDKALETFYEKRILEVKGCCENIDLAFQERHLRYWIDKNLITDYDTRNLLIQTEEEPDTEGMPNEIIDFLVEKKLFHKINRGTQNMIELSHDRLIPIIQSSNAKWEDDLRLLLKNAAYWNDGNDSKFLLTPDQFKEEMEWVKENNITLSPDEQKFVAACEQLALAEQAKIERAVEQEKSRRTRRFASIATALAVLALISTIIAVIFYWQANLAKIEADNNAAENATLAATNDVIAKTARAAEADAKVERDNAEYQQGLAQTAAVDEQKAADEAIAQKRVAETAQAEAELAQGEAETARATAEFNFEMAQEQASIAFSRQLAAQATGYLRTQPDLSSLLSIEAFRVHNTWEATSLLLANTQYGLQHTFQQVGPNLPIQFSDITAVALSQDGERMAWGDAGGNVAIYNYSTGVVELNRVAHSEPVKGLSFSPDGQTLASGGEDSQIFLWDIQTRQRTILAGVLNSVYALAYSPDGRSLAAATGTALTIWDMSAIQENPVLLRGHSSDIYALAWSPDNQQIASGDGGRWIFIWDVELKQRINSYRDHKDLINALAWSSSDLLASGSRNGELFIRNMNSDELVSGPTFPSGNTDILGLSFNYEGDLLASGGGDRRIIVTDMNSMRVVAHLSGQYRSAVSVLAFLQLPGSYLLASGSYDNSLGLHNVAPIQPLSEVIQTLNGEILALQLDGNNRGLLGLKTNRRCEIYELADTTAAPLYQLTGDCFSLAISPDLSMLAMGDSSGGITLFDAQNGETIGESLSSEYGPANAMAFNSVGSSLASAHCAELSRTNGQETCTSVQIPLWDVSNAQPQEPVFELHSSDDIFPGTIYALAFQAGDDILAFAGDGKKIYQWQIADGAFTVEIGLPMASHADTVTALTYGPMGSSSLQVLSSSSQDNSLVFWNPETSQQLNGALPQSNNTILSMAISADGRHLLSGSQDGTLLRWDIDPSSWIERLCQQTGRNLTESEWALFFPREAYRETCE
jgi:WD40 repeat protein